MSLEKDALKIYQNAEKMGGKATRDVLKQYKSAMDNILAEIAQISLKYGSSVVCVGGIFGEGQQYQRFAAF